MDNTDKSTKFEAHNNKNHTRTQPMTNKLRLVLSILALGIFLVPYLAYSQQRELIDTTVGNYSATFPQGMSSKTCYNVLKDKNGFIWFCNQNCIDRYDGQIFQHYSLGKSNVRGYRDGFQLRIVIDSDGVIWSWSERSIISKYNASRDCFEEVVRQQEKGLYSSVRCLYPVDDNNLLIGTYNGIKFFDLKKDSVTSECAEDLSVTCIKSYCNGQLLFGSSNGLWSCNLSDHKVKRIFGENLEIYTVFYDEKRDIIWAGTNGNGLYMVNNKDHNDYKAIANSENAIIKVMTMLNDSVLLVATDGQGLKTCHLPSDISQGIEPLRLLASESPNAPIKIPNSVVDDILVDDDKLWLTLNMSGIALLKPLGESSIMENPAATSNSDYNALDVSVDPQGRIWAAYTRLLACYDTPSSKPNIYLHGEGAGFLGLMAAQDGTIWAGGYNAGTYHLDPSTGKYDFFRSVADQPVLDCVYSFCEDNNHDIWVGGLNFPLTRMHSDDNGGYERTHYGLTMITDLRTLDDNRIAAGTFDGLYIVNIETKEILPYIKEENVWPYSTAIASLTITDDKKIWAATMGAGLVCLDPDTGEVSQYGSEYSLPSLELRGIEQFNDSILVVSTETNGIFSFDIRNHCVISNLIHADGKTIGIMSRSCSSVSPDHKLIVFGGEQGAIAVTEKDIVSDNKPYRIFVNCEQMTDGVVYLSAEFNTLYIQFTTNDIFSQEKYRFEYKIDGLTDTWQKVDDTRRLRYLNMPSGNHLMKVRAYSAANIVDEIEIPIEVETYFWLRWYCKLLYALLVIGLIWFIAFHYRMKRFSETDYLTGINNRYAGQEKIINLIEQNVPGYFVLMDYDKFKDINDNYGHNVGDKMLIAVAHALRSTFPDQITMRLGGDEFALFLTNCNSEQEFKEKIEQLKKAFKAVDIPEMNHAYASVSMGAIYYDGTKRVSFDQLYTESDKLLYSSKEFRHSHVTVSTI